MSSTTKSEHIALLIGSLRGGGSERVCVTLANALAERGYRVDLVVLNLDRAKYEHDVDERVRLINLRVSAVRTSFLRLRRYLRDERPQLVLTFAPQLAVAIVLLRFTGLSHFALVARTGTILSKKNQHARDLWNRYVSATLTRWWYSKADVIIAQSRGMARDLAFSQRVPAEKIVTIPNPLTPKVFGHASSLKGEVHSSNRVLFVGRLDPPKDPLFLLRAFRECCLIRPNLHLDIVGTGVMRAEVEAAVEQLGLADRVTLHGFRSDVQTFYSQAAVTVLCSRYEGLPNCLIESIAVGTPVVALDCDHGPRDIVIDNVNGFLIHTRDERLFAAGILRAIDGQWDTSALRASLERFETREVVNRYEEVMLTVLKRLNTDGNSYSMV